MKVLLIGLVVGLAPICVGQEGEGVESAWDYLAGKYDKDADGKITRAEYTRDDEHWKRLDTNGDGWLDQAEFEQGGRRGRGGRPGGRSGGGSPRKGTAPREGEKAPAFALELLPEHGKQKEEAKAKEGKEPKPEVVSLASYKGKKPVALIFGSYT
ncbi:MAG: hypothetical protein O7B99_13455 [Planctomycetota bacterium]|nr:hypothetical protein [Planctomycetota bacterium]